MVVSSRDAVQAHGEELALPDCQDPCSPISTACSDARTALEQLPVSAGSALHVTASTVLTLPVAGDGREGVRLPVHVPVLVWSTTAARGVS
jgi:hypothetical protein